MSVTKNTGFVVNGVGSGVLIPSDGGDPIEITRGQDMSLEITSSDEDVYGGDGLFPFFTFTKEKGGKITINDATFKLNQLKVTQNATINSATAKKYVREEITVSGATTATLGNTSGVDYSTATCFDSDTGAIYTNMGTDTPTTNTEYAVTAAGVVTFGAAVTATLVFSYYVTDTSVVSATVMTNVVPGVNELRWQMTTQDEDGNDYKISIRAKKVKTAGSFNLDFKRASASVQKLEFKVLEPGDDSNEFLEVIVENA